MFFSARTISILASPDVIGILYFSIPSASVLILVFAPLNISLALYTGLLFVSIIFNFKVL